MEEFVKRLKSSVLSFMDPLMMGILTLVCIILFAYLFLLLPAWLLTFVIGDLGYAWVVIGFWIIPIVTEWQNIKKWINWQLIENFKKQY
jgi:hypothetical protein